MVAAVGASRQRTRGTRRLTITAGPELIRPHAGDPVGIEVFVELTDDGERVDIDPHRRIINPPAGGDPREAFWEILWASVEGTPR